MQFCNERRVPVMRIYCEGRSLAKELVGAAAAHNADILVLTTGDSLAVDGANIREVVALTAATGDSHFDLRCKGGEVRAITRRDLNRLPLDKLSAEDHEHGLTWFYDQTGISVDLVSVARSAKPGPNLSVDTAEDLAFANARFKEISQWAPSADLVKEWTKHGTVRPA